jgi:hypothetical protein
MEQLKKGHIISSGNFKLTKKITSLDKLMEILDSKPSIFLRHRMYPTAFVRSMQLHSIHISIKRGLLWDTDKIKK